MDEIVKAALIKWPNVPHCYGWLALDARGNWRMRDQRSQALNLPGDTIRHATLLAFINRNYLPDARGCWYFQNGPQRVYVDLEATPYIARTAPTGFLLHTGAVLESPQCAYFDAAGCLVLQAAGTLAQIDDRDLAECLSLLRMQGLAVSDEALCAWLEAGAPRAALALRLPGMEGIAIPVHFKAGEDLMQEQGFVRKPRE